jgi:hypothetical protein
MRNATVGRLIENIKEAVRNTFRDCEFGHGKDLGYYGVHEEEFEDALGVELKDVCKGYIEDDGILRDVIIAEVMEVFKEVEKRSFAVCSEEELVAEVGNPRLYKAVVMALETETDPRDLWHLE